MTETEATGAPRILVLATEACAYPGADYVGQTHTEYPASVFILRIPAPALLPLCSLSLVHTVHSIKKKANIYLAKI